MSKGVRSQCVNTLFQDYHFQTPKYAMNVYTGYGWGECVCV